MNKRAFTLIELMVGVVISSLAALFGITLYLAQLKEAKQEEARNTAASMIRQFLNAEKKSLDVSMGTELVAFTPSKQMNSKNLSVCTISDPTNPGDCQEVHRALNLTLRTNPLSFPMAVYQANRALLETFTETVEVECVGRYPSVPNIDLKTLPGRSWDAVKKDYVSSAPVVFSQCVPADCAADSNGILSSQFLPRIKVTRRLPQKVLDGAGAIIDVKKTTTASGTEQLDFQESVVYYPPSEPNLSSGGMNGNPVAATVCIQVPPGRTQTADNYRDISLAVFVLTRSGENTFDIVQQVANLPRPKIETDDSIKVLGKVPKSN